MVETLHLVTLELPPIPPPDEDQTSMTQNPSSPTTHKAPSPPPPPPTSDRVSSQPLPPPPLPRKSRRNSVKDIEEDHDYFIKRVAIIRSFDLYQISSTPTNVYVENLEAPISRQSSSSVIFAFKSEASAAELYSHLEEKGAKNVIGDRFFILHAADNSIFDLF
jgi:hypothetical protein